MKRRVLTALVGIPIVLGAVGCTNPLPLAILLLAAGAICVLEAEGLYSEKGNLDPLSLSGLLALLVAAVALSFQQVDLDLILPAAVVLWLLGGFSAWTRVQGSTNALSKLLSTYWFAVPLIALLKLHPFGEGWDWRLPNAVLMALLPIWAGDTAAMLGGKAFGKHPLAPKISPNKTWEGAIANFLASTLVGWAVGAWLGYPLWVGLACGGAAGVFGQVGDLFESALKRAAGKKDSGGILPGHGGVLDRIDALLGAAMPIWLILWLSGSI